jgi:hypothetical protein
MEKAGDPKTTGPNRTSNLNTNRELRTRKRELQF